MCGTLGPSLQYRPALPRRGPHSGAVRGGAAERGCSSTVRDGAERGLRGESGFTQTLQNFTQTIFTLQLGRTRVLLRSFR